MADKIAEQRINYNTKSLQYDFSVILDSIPQRLRSRFYIQFQRIWQTFENEGNDDGVKKVLGENFTKLKNSGFNLSVDINYRVFKGILCYADRMNYANINYDGNYVHTILIGKNDTVEDVSSVFNFLSKFHNISSWKIDIASPSLYKSESYENIRSRYDNVHYLDDKRPLAELLCFLSVYQRLYLVGKYIIQ